MLALVSGGPSQRLVRRTPLYDVHRTASAAYLKRLTAGGMVEHARFVEEARRMKSLDHPAILAVNALGGDGGPPHQMIEAFDGHDLSVLQKMLASSGTVVPAKAALAIIAEAASALEHAHEKGIMHGFFGPHCLLIGTDGAVKVTDFRLGAEPEKSEETDGARGDLAALGAMMRFLCRSDLDPQVAQLTDDLVKKRYASATAVVDAAEAAFLERGGKDPADEIAAWLEVLLPRLPGDQPTRARNGLPAPREPTPLEPATALEQQAIVDEDPLIGRVVDGRYRIIEPIGSGGMGTIYRALQLAIDREVAVKTVRPGAEEVDDAVFARFKSEAQIISQLRHPNTLRLFDFGRMDGELYLITELLHGSTLEDRLAEGTLDPKTVVTLLIDLADALSEAHKKGIVHRDIKPRNLFLDRVGEREIIKILDFGLAKLQGMPKLTVVGSIVGSPAYMSPEQATGGDITPRSDLYSLGITAFEMLAGHPPFEAGNPQALLLKQRHDTPPKFSELMMTVPAGLEALIREMLAKNPADRPASADELRARLTALEAEWSRSAASSNPKRVTTTSGRDTMIGAVFHSYRLEELLGSGSISRVYRAHHEVLGREVAVKVLTDAGLRSETTHKRLQREAKALAALAHPSAVEVLDFGIAPDGTPYMVMECIRGRTLKQLTEATGPLPPARAAHIVKQICDVLVAAHALGLIHRDLKPSNVMVLDRDRVKVVDFGIARMVDASDNQTRLTENKALLGSPAYMAPEQIENPSGVGPSADLYALGGVLYSLIAGHSPFLGSVHEVLHKARTARPVSPPPAAGLDTLAMWLLQKRPEDRPPDAKTVLAELERLGLVLDPVAESEELLPSLTIPILHPRTQAAVPVATRSRWPLLGMTILAAAASAAVVVLALKPSAPNPVPAPVPTPLPTVAVAANPAPIGAVAPSEPPKPVTIAPIDVTPVPAARPKATEAAKPRFDPAPLESRLRSALEKRGLSSADIPRELAAELDAARKAIATKDSAVAEPAVERAVAKTAELRIDPRLVSAKLKRINEALVAKAKAGLAPEAVQALDDRNFALFKRLNDHDPPEPILRDAAALERELR